MYEEEQVAGVIIPQADGDEVAGIIVNDGTDVDELADTQLGDVAGGERPPPMPH